MGQRPSLGVTIDIDDLLTKSHPPVAPRTMQLEHDLNALVQEIESLRQRPRRKLRRATIGTGIVAGVLSLGVVGAAAVMNDGVLWFTTTAAGDKCDLEFSVDPVGPEDTANGGSEQTLPGRTTWPSESEQNRTATEARKFLRSFDYDEVDRPAAIRKFDAEQRRVIAAAEPGEAQPLLTGNELETDAVRTVVFAALFRHLESVGLSPDAIITVTGSSVGCAK